MYVVAVVVVWKTICGKQKQKLKSRQHNHATKLRQKTEIVLCVIRDRENWPITDDGRRTETAIAAFKHWSTSDCPLQWCAVLPRLNDATFPTTQVSNEKNRSKTQHTHTQTSDSMVAYMYWQQWLIAACTLFIQLINNWECVREHAYVCVWVLIILHQGERKRE